MLLLHNLLFVFVALHHIVSGAVPLSKRFDGRTKSEASSSGDKTSSNGDITVTDVTTVDSTTQMTEMSTDGATDYILFFKKKLETLGIHLDNHFANIIDKQPTEWTGDADCLTNEPEHITPSPTDIPAILTQLKEFISVDSPLDYPMSGDIQLPTTKTAPEKLSELEKLKMDLLEFLQDNPSLEMMLITDGQIDKLPEAVLRHRMNGMRYTIKGSNTRSRLEMARSQNSEYPMNTQPHSRQSPKSGKRKPSTRKMLRKTKRMRAKGKKTVKTAKDREIAKKQCVSKNEDIKSKDKINTNGNNVAKTNFTKSGSVESSKNNPGVIKNRDIGSSEAISEGNSTGKREQHESNGRGKMENNESTSSAINSKYNGVSSSNSGKSRSKDKGNSERLNQRIDIDVSRGEETGDEISGSGDSSDEESSDEDSSDEISSSSSDEDDDKLSTYPYDTQYLKYRKKYHKN